MGFEILVIILLILVNGFFSLSEMAVVSARKARLRQRAEDGHKGARLALETANKPGRFLSTIQIVITLVGTIAGAFGGATIADKLAIFFRGAGMRADLAQPLAFGTVVVLIAFLSVVLGELVPKGIALSKPEIIAGAVAYPMSVFSIIFAPIVKILSATTDLILFLLGTRRDVEPPVTEEEVKVLIAQGTETGIFDEREKAMFEGVLYLGDKRVTTFMTPRTDILYIDLSDSPEIQAKRLLENAGYSNLPLADGDLDHIKGIIKVQPVLAAMARGDFSTLDPFVEAPLLVPESLSALNLFSRFMEGGKRVAVILDEYGGVAGMVTFSDLAETILDDALNAGSSDVPGVVQREDGSWLVDGGLSIDDFAERFELEDEGIYGDYETVAGFVLDRMGSIPRAGESFSWNGWTVEVMDMDGNRVDKVLVTRPASTGSDSGGDSNQDSGGDSGADATGDASGN